MIIDNLLCQYAKVSVVKHLILLSLSGVDLDFWKGGHSQTYYYVDVGLAGYELSLCAKHASTRGSGGIPSGIFEKLHSLRLNLRTFLVIDHPLMLLWTQVHKTSQYEAITCMCISM